MQRLQRAGDLAAIYGIGEVEAAGSADRAKVRDALSKIKYDSAMGEVTFDDHNQARLPMILLQIENGKPAIKGAYAAEIKYPAK